MDNIEKMIEERLNEGRRVNPKYVRLEEGSGVRLPLLISEMESIIRELKLWSKDNVSTVVAYDPGEWFPRWE